MEDTGVKFLGCGARGSKGLCGFECMSIHVIVKWVIGTYNETKNAKRKGRIDLEQQIHR